MTARRAWPVALALAAALALPGCAGLGYYAQSARGHLALVSGGRPVETLIEDPATGPALRERLRRARAVRDFASDVLGLPRNRSYRDYVALDRPYAVWTVVAAPEFSLAPRTWCFPVAGCVSYRGYFDPGDARRFAVGLRTAGMDTYVAGVRAYSTLGWFDDPLLSTVLEQPEYRFAGTVFHELAHQRLYVKDDSAFNEAFAMVVEREGVRRWLASHGDAASRARHARSLERAEGFVALVNATRARLEALYAAGGPEDTLRAAKSAAFDRLRADYADLRERWGGDGRYDAWFGGELNNARLALVATYNAQVPALERVLASVGGDLRSFYRACEELAALDPAERRRRLDALAPGRPAQSRSVPTISPSPSSRG